MKKTVAQLAACLISICGPAGAEDLFTIFRSSEFGADSWADNGACVVPGDDGHVIIRECDPKKSYGDAYIAKTFPYFEHGIVELDIDNIVGGDVTFQILYFRGDQHIDTREPVSHIKFKDRRTIHLDKLHAPQDVDLVMFKLWTAGIEGGAFEIGDLVYKAPIETNTVRLDVDFMNRSEWKYNKARLLTSPSGSQILLYGQTRKGSLLYHQKVPRKQDELFMIDLPVVSKGTVTVQAVNFDQNGKYLYSFDMLTELGEGTHSVRLDDLPWPTHGDSYMIKISLTGEQDASAILKRMLLFKALPMYGT